MARADEPAPTTTEATPTSASPPASQQLAIPKGGLVINAFLNLDLSNNEVGQPISISPDIWYGVTDDLTVGLVHSATGTTGFYGAPGTSICFNGQVGSGMTAVDLCGGHPYNNVGAEVRYRLKEPFTAEGGVYFLSLDPQVVMALKVGVGIRKRWDKIALEVSPSIFITVVNRSDPVTNTMTPSVGSNEALFIPATVTYDLADKMDVSAQIGLQIVSLQDAGDSYSVPIGVAYRYHIDPKLSVGLAVVFPDLIAKNGTGDARFVSIGASYATK